MSASSRKTALKLPRLKTKEELLRVRRAVCCKIDPLH